MTLKLVQGSLPASAVGERFSKSDTTQPTRTNSQKEADMAEITRDELNARLEAVESRLDSKLASISAELRVISTQLVTSIEISRKAESAANAAKDAAIATRWNIALTALATVGVVVAVVLGVYGVIWQVAAFVGQSSP